MRVTAFLLLGLWVGQTHAATRPAEEGRHWMVVSAHHLASEAGDAILEQGGNAVDAAVATAYALAVVNPCCGNLGGGGFMTIHLAATSGAAARDVFLDFRETAPAAATAGMFLDPEGKVVPQSSVLGWRAVAVPGSVAGLDAALARYGSLPREQVMAPAIALARDGFVLAPADIAVMDFRADAFARDPAVAKIFLRPDGKRWQAGNDFVQTDLAYTLTGIAMHGPEMFGSGRVAAAIAAAAHEHGGLLAEADLAAYSPVERTPLACDYRGHHIVTAPLPSSGGVVLCELLALLSPADLHTMGFHAAAGVHRMAEAMRHTYLDRNAFLGDPAFVADPTATLLSNRHIAAVLARIDPDRATPSASLGAGEPPHEKPETTHLSVLDGAGNAVALTTTLNGAFGAVVMAPGTGVLLNDEMDDFTIRADTPNLFGLVQGAANAIAPGKRPLSSMAPTIVTRDGRVEMVLGAPGGSRIPTEVLEVLIDLIDHGMSPQEAVDAPRIHHQFLPDTLFVEPFALSPDTGTLLRGMGYRIVEQAPWGAAELIVVGPPAPPSDTPSSGGDSAVSSRMRPGIIYGASDDRRPSGRAVGQ